MPSAHSICPISPPRCAANGGEGLRKRGSSSRRPKALGPAAKDAHAGCFAATALRGRRCCGARKPVHTPAFQQTALCDSSWLKYLTAPCPGERRRQDCTLPPPDSRQAGSAITSWRCWPNPSIPNSTTSPARKNCGGFFPMPTPGGVPVEITSPGCSVMNWLRYDTTCATP